MAMGLFALALAYLTWWQAALCAVAAFLHNLFILPHTARFALRGEKPDAGILTYPLSVLFLILIFYNRLDLAAAAWAYLAFGDGMATVLGKALPLWRPRRAGGKSAGGMLGFALAGSLAANLLYNFVGEHAGFHPELWIIGILLALFELLPMPVNDNATLPLASAALLAVTFNLTLTTLPSGKTLLIALGINAGIALLALAARLVSSSALVGGILVGTLILSFGRFPAFSLLVGFFILATGATKFGYRHKQKLGVEQEKGGRRGSRHALANCSVGTLLALLLPFVPVPLPFRVALAAAFATALADTLGSELGSIYGKTPIHPMTFKKVPVGTEGAVSLEGTLTGLIGAAFLGALPLLWDWYSVPAALLVAAAAFAGSMAESYLGVLGKWDNEILNFVNTALGAAAGYGLAVLIL